MYGNDLLEREIVLSRVFDAPRERVFQAWTTDAVGKWFGPRGFVCKTKELNVKVGGRWRFDFIAPDGTVYDNRIVYTEIRPHDRIVYEHSSDKDDDPNRFHVTLTFDEQDDKKTVVTLRQVHPTAARRKWAIGFGAVELGYQTLDKLAEALAR
jgi:uncharacterized protein YndB with AHSA1/START domain